MPRGSRRPAFRRTVRFRRRERPRAATSSLPPDQPSDPAPPILRLRGPRASTVITQHYPADQADTFMAWQREVAALAGAYPGYQATEVYPPTGGGDEWVIIIHFDDEAKLQAWLDAPERAAWLAKLPAEAHGWRQQTMPTGFGTWVAGQAADGTPIPQLEVVPAGPPRPVPGGHAADAASCRRGPSTSARPSRSWLGNILSVATLQWAVMPLLNRALAPWLAGPRPRRPPRVASFGAARHRRRACSGSRSVGAFTPP